MRINLQQVCRAIILLVFVIFIVRLHYTGDILKLINPKYMMLSKTAAILFLILFIAQIQRILEPNTENHEHHDHHHDHGNTPFSFKKFISYVVIILPLFTGFVFPMTTLDASIAANKGTMFSLSKHANQVDESGTKSNEKASDVPKEDINGSLNNELQQDDNPEDPNLYSNTISQKEYDKIVEELAQKNSIEMNEQMYTTYYQEINMNPDKYVGKEIKVKGFVYKEDSFPGNQFVLGRFVITHCVADAGVIGFLTELDIAEELESDTWIEVVGTIYLQEYEGDLLPAIKVTNINMTEEPNQPYLYPISIKIM